MKIFFAITLPIFLLSSCGGSKVVQMNLCNNGKKVEIYKERNTFSKEQKNIILFFDTGFNSKVKLQINNTVIADTIINSTPVSIPDVFSYSYNTEKEKQMLKVQTDVDCLEIELDKGYKVLGLYNYSDKWVLSYRKELPVFE
ncbi:hypothetical protein [Empedobacter brevis]|uniref:hypothetical protein n=1 Tax=Empedobacter brevis TaxID=247 RepID=UPI002FE14FCA